jgi:hypothetical protein
MPRIIVTTDPVDERHRPVLRDESPVLLDERVDSVHLCDGHAAEQLIERLAWAVTDAEETRSTGRARAPRAEQAGHAL